MTSDLEIFVATRRGPAGFALIAVLFFVMILAGLGMALLSEAFASRTALEHNETSIAALEQAQTGLVHAEAEIRALKDFGTDGIGVLDGTWGNGSYRVEATQNTISPDRWTIRATGTFGLSVRRIREEVRRRANHMFVDALFSRESVTLGGGSPTDAYDSRTGSYLSQAVNKDAAGTYAQLGGNIGSNGTIELQGTGVRVRGNAIPGPQDQVEFTGGASVTGDILPRMFDVPLDAVPYSDFANAMTSNSNALITSNSSSGNTVRYQPGRMTLDVAGGSTLTLGGGTYFFSEVSLKGNSIVKVTGPVKIYVTSLLDFGAGAQLLADHPGDVQIFAHPYSLPPSVGSITETRIKVNSGSKISWAMYGPYANMSLGGGNEFFGAAVSNSVAISGGNTFHYDKALGEAMILGAAWLEHLYWVEDLPPRR